MRSVRRRTTVLVPPLGVLLEEECISAIPSLGAVVIATILRAAGEDVTIVDPVAPMKTTTERSVLETLTSVVLDASPDVIGFSTTSGLYAFTLLMAEECKRRAPECLIVLGGPQASATWEETLRACPWVDVVAVGEADLNVVPLWDALGDSEKLREVPGLAFIENGQVCRTHSPPPITNLDELPIPDYRLLPPSLSRQFAVAPVPIETGRGCPHSCSFCSTSIFWGSQYRLKSIPRVIEEIRTHGERLGRSFFGLTVDMLPVKRGWTAEFCKAVQELRPPIQWGCYARADSLDAELIRQMSDAGCVRVFMGIESASRRVQKLINKNIDPDRARQTLRYLDTSEITPVLSFILGFPEETEEELLQTLAFALQFRLELQPRTEFQFSTLVPLPQTELSRRYKSLLCLDRFGGQAVTPLPFPAPQRMWFIRENPELCMVAYHYHSEHFSRERTAKLCLLLDHLFSCMSTVKLLERVWGSSLPLKLYESADAVHFRSPRSLCSNDQAPEEMETYLEAAFRRSDGRQTEVACWRDLYRFEAALIRLRRLPEQETNAGITLDVTYDIRLIEKHLSLKNGIPEVSPAARPLRIWCTRIGKDLRAIVMPVELASSLGIQ